MHTDTQTDKWWLAHLQSHSNSHWHTKHNIHTHVHNDTHTHNDSLKLALWKTEIVEQKCGKHNYIILQK